MKVQVIKSVQEIAHLRGKRVGYDVETTGSPRKGYEPDHNLATIQIYEPEEDTTYIIPIRTNGKNIQISNELREIITSLRVIGHYLQFDLDRTRNDLETAPTPVGDTYLLACMLQWQNKGLKSIVAALIPDSKAIAHITDVIDITYPIEWNLTDEKQLRYMANDPYYSYTVHKILEDNGTIAKLGKAYKADVYALNQFARSRTRGIGVDMKRYDELIRTVSNEIEELEQEVTEKAGRTCKVNSPKDLQRLLFLDLALPETPIKTSTGAPSTSEEALQYLIDKHPVVPTILKLKHKKSVLSNSKKLPEFLYDDGRLHPEFRQIGEDATSRVYTTKPSANQYPRELRDCLTADKGKKILYFDWSAAELLCAAYWAKDEELLRWYKEGDTIAEIAKRILHKETITEEERSKVKIVIYSSLYGSEGAAASRTLRVPQEETEKIIKGFFQEFPKVAELKAKIEQKAIKTTYTHTIMGRPRKLPQIRSMEGTSERNHAVRQAFNTAIQSSVADLLKVATGKTARYEKDGIQFVITVFDSMILQIPEEITEKEYTPIIEELSTFNDLKFKYKHATGLSWRECQDQT